MPWCCNTTAFFAWPGCALIAQCPLSVIFHSVSCLRSRISAFISISLRSSAVLLFLIYYFSSTAAGFGVLFPTLVHLRLLFATVSLLVAWSVPAEVICLLLLIYNSAGVLAWIGALYRTFIHLSLFFAAVYLSLAWSVPFAFFLSAAP